MSWRSSCIGSRASTFLFCTVLLAVAPTATLLVPSAAEAAPLPFLICAEPGGQAGPEIAGSMVVWTDNRSGNLDIYGRNLSTHAEVVVCDNDQAQDNPAITRFVTGAGISRYVAVWVDKRNHQTTRGSDIYGRDISTGADFVVARSPAIKWYPDIVDRWVVWIEADHDAGPYRIMARNLAAHAAVTVATSKVLSPVAVDRRRARGRTVYTVVYASGKGNISGRNLPSGSRFVISRTRAYEWMPDISGNRVVWWEAGGRIMMKDLRNGKRTFVHRGARPRICGQLVVWDGGGHGGSFTIKYNENARIFLRDLASSAGTVAVGQKKLACLFPAASKTQIVWESGPAERVLSGIHIYGARVK